MKQHIRYLFALVLVCGACEKKPAQPAAPEVEAHTKKSAPEPAHPTPQVPDDVEPAITMADPGKDDPATPTWLPRPDEIAGWARISNVDAVYPGEWHRLGDGRTKDCAEAFSIKAAYTCRYVATLPASNSMSDGHIGNITLFEAYSSDDAYGLFTAMSPAEPHSNLVGSSSCIERVGKNQVVHGWQGRFYIHVIESPRRGPKPQISVEKLAAGLVRPIPSAEPPVILSNFPPDKRVPGHVWVARRHLHIFPESVHRDVLLGSARPTTKALGLNLDTLMAVVAYDPGDGEKPNYVWLIEYPNAQEAKAALGQYKAVLRKIKPTPLVLMDLPAGPNGRYLSGTWTADQESIDSMHILNAIARKLSDG